MAGSFNTTIIVGHLGRDPETRTVNDGTVISDFSVATTERRRGPDGQQQEHTTWFRASAFGKLAETCNQYLKRGSYVYIEGPISLREFVGRDGVQRSSLEVRVRDMRMLDKRADGQGDASEPAIAAMGAASTDPDLGDLPF